MSRRELVTLWARDSWIISPCFHGMDSLLGENLISIKPMRIVTVMGDAKLSRRAVLGSDA